MAQKQTATPEMRAAVLRVRPSERLAAMRAAEKAFFACLSSPNFVEEFAPEHALRDMAGRAAAAEVVYFFA